jgi:hypothetical protein
MAIRRKPASQESLTSAVAALQTQLEKLVELIGDEDDTIGNDAVHALYTLNELVAKPLAAAILHPRNRVHRLKAIFLARLVVPKYSLDVQKALCEVSRQLEDERVASLAGIILTELIGDELDQHMAAMHWTKRGSETAAHATTAFNSRLQQVLAPSQPLAQGSCDHGPEQS